MGCGKSKQAVETANVVIKTKSSNSIKINDPVVEKAEEGENVQEFGNAKQNDVDGCTENVKDTKENTKEKDGADVKGEPGAEDKAKNVGEEENVVENDQQKLNSYDHSPGNILLPIRDHEETIESVVSEGISGNDAVEGEAEADTNNEKGTKVDEGKEVVIIEETKEPATTGEEKSLDVAEK